MKFIKLDREHFNIYNIVSFRHSSGNLFIRTLDHETYKISDSDGSLYAKLKTMVY